MSSNSSARRYLVGCGVSAALLWVIGLANAAAHRASTVPADPFLAGRGSAPESVTLIVDPKTSEIHWTLGATAHTVHGTFQVSKGAIHVDPATGKASGEIVVSAASGQSGNDGRDKKMQGEVLESSRYPDIVFQPDHVEGKIRTPGNTTLQIHGTFSLHGTPHELTVPVDGSLSADRWTATSKFSIPYVSWGLKNPSTFLLRVKQEVEIELNLQGQLQAGSR